MIVKIVLCYVILLAIPFMVGMLYNKIVKHEITELLSNWISGFVLCLGLFQILVLPCIVLKTSLTMLTWIYAIIVALVCIISVVNTKGEFGKIWEKVCIWTKQIPWQTIFVVALIAVQIYMYVVYTHTDYDDTFYVATSVIAVDTDTIFQYDPYTGDLYAALPKRYVLSPFPIFVAMLSKLSGIHATILAHTVLPPVYLLLSYGVYALVGTELFKGKRKSNAWFLSFVGLISIYLYTTDNTQAAFMLMRIWQGKAFLAAMLLPYVFYLGYKMIADKWENKEWIMLLFAMLSCCLVSSMGIMLGAIMAGIMGILNAYAKRNIKSLIKPVLCCVPNIVLAAIYLIM